MSHPLRTLVRVGADDGFCKTENRLPGDNLAPLNQTAACRN